MSLIRKIAAPHELVKEASGARVQLPPARTEWSRAVLKEAYKQVPILQDYAVDLEWGPINETRGVGIGKLLVKEATLDKVRGAPIVAIPIVVRDRKMHPLDVLLVGQEAMALTEEKIASQFENLSLGGRQEFSNRPKRGRNSSLYRYMSPDGVGGGTNSAGANSSGGNVVKMAAAMAAPGDREKLASLAAVIRGAGDAFYASVDEALTAPSVTSSDLASALKQVIPTDLVEFRTRRDGAYVKHAASRDFYFEDSTVCTRAEVESMVGQEKLAQLDTHGVIRFVHIPALARDMESVSTAVRGSGIYKVASGGAEQPAVVFKGVFDFRTGVRDDSCLVLTKTGGAIAHDLGGVFMRPITLDEMGAPLAGVSGTFVWEEGDEKVASSIAHIDTREVVDGVESFLVRIAGGREGRVYLGRVKTAQAVGDGYVLPRTAKFLPASYDSQSFRSAGDYDAMLKAAFAGSGGTVVVRGINDHLVVYEGGAVGGLAGVSMDKKAAARVAALLGVPRADNFLAKVSTITPATFQTSCRITTADDAMEQEKAAAARDHGALPAGFGFAEFPVRVAAAVSSYLSTYPEETARGYVRANQLVGMQKKASALPPERETVDAVLSLNFLNPDNLRVLRSYLPVIEKTAGRLAELLVATRMGLGGDPEPIRLAMQYVERVAGQLRHVIPGNA